MTLFICIALGLLAIIAILLVATAHHKSKIVKQLKQRNKDINKELDKVEALRETAETWNLLGEYAEALEYLDEAEKLLNKVRSEYFE